MAALMPEAEDRPQRSLTREGYHAMAELGILKHDDRVELIDGMIVMMLPISPWHASSNARLNDSLRRIYGVNALVSVGNPVGLGRNSEPQPDVTVLRCSPDFYASAHPQAEDVILLIEISDSTRTFDLSTKRGLYAGSGIAEYWVVDGVRRCVHVFRHPQEGLFLESRIYLVGEEILLPDCEGRTLAVSEMGLE